MPSIKLNKKRVKKLIGKDVSDDLLKEKISYLGTDLEEITKDEIIVEIFPNRPDLLSEEGFARALKTFLGFSSGLKKYSVKKSDYRVIVDSSVNKVRPFTACLVAKNIKINEGVLNNIINIQEKLHITFGRNRKKCAIGVYPLDNIVFPVHYSAINPEDIYFIPLGEVAEMDGYDLLKKTKAGKDYGHLLINESLFPVFKDSNKNVMSVPPILNSKHAGTVDLNTNNLFVECSGHDFDVLSKALNMIGAALSDMGADIYSVNVEYDDKKRITPNFDPSNIYVEYDYIKKYIGFDLGKNEIVHLLEKMGFGASSSSSGFNVSVPCYRADIIHPVDVVEDICIAYGFDNFNIVKDTTHSVGKEFFNEKVKEKIRDVFVGDNLIENVSYSLLKFNDQKILGLKNIIKIKNPNTSEYNSLRVNLFPVILKNFKNNKMNEYPQRVFEIGRVFNKSKDDFLENNNLCVAICSDSSSFTWAKQRLDLLKNLLDLDITYTQKDFDFFIKGRGAEVKIKINNKLVSIGFIGEVNLHILRLYDLEHPVSLFELDIDIISNIIKNRNE
jgi:phenylalanyl-tRNA synthetase beta chain